MICIFHRAAKMVPKNCDAPKFLQSLQSGAPSATKRVIPMFIQYMCRGQDRHHNRGRLPSIYQLFLMFSAVCSKVLTSFPI